MIVVKSGSDKDIVIRKVAMFLLAVFPILNYYQGPVLSFGTWAFIIAILITIGNKGIHVLSYPKRYLYFWAYCSIAIFIAADGFKASYLIPGGLSLFVWSIILGFIFQFFDCNYLIKYVTYIFAIAAIILVLQEAAVLTQGSRFTAFLPFSNDLTYGISRTELLNVQRYSSRSCSFFAEPSHFAQFVLPLLAYNLFQKENSKKLFPILSIFIVLVLLLLRSGNGLIGAIVLLIGKSIYYFRFKTTKAILVMAVLLPLLFVSVRWYASTEFGGSVVERTAELENNEDSGSYIRLYRGYVVYQDLPLINKVFGVSLDNLLQMNLPLFMMRGDKMYDSYFNGVQMVLIHLGFLGLFFLFFFYLHLAREGDPVSVAVILTFLLLSLMGQMYLSSTMLICTGIAYTHNKKVLYEK